MSDSGTVRLQQAVKLQKAQNSEHKLSFANNRPPAQALYPSLLSAPSCCQFPFREARFGALAL